MDRARAWWVAMAVCGGWIAILPSSTLTLALRLKDWQIESGATGYTEYSLIEIAAWLVLIVSLIVSGRIADRLALRVGGTARLLAMGLIAVVVLSVALAVSPSVPVLAVVWMLLQVPAAVIISTSLGWGGRHVDSSRRNLMSGLVGAAPIVALLIGSVAVRATGSAPVVFALVGVVSAAATLPLLRSARWATPRVDQVDERPVVSMSSYLRTFAAIWIAVLVADFLLSNATAITNTYVVAFVDSVPAFAGDVATVASQTLLLASLCALAASVISGFASRGLRASAGCFAVGCASVSAGILIVLVWPGTAGITLGAILLGAGFGAANGAEMALVLAARTQSSDSGSDLGVLNALTSLPYVLIPLVAVPVMAGSVAHGVRTLYWIAVFLVAVGAVIAGWIATRDAVVPRTPRVD